jgi:phage terminase small subunit
MSSAPVPAKDPLNKRQRAFVLAYLADPKREGKAAAVKAGYSAKTGDVIASRLLKVPAIAAEIAAVVAEERRSQADEFAITREKTLRQTAIGAFFDTRKLLNHDGSPKPLHELDYETASQIAGFEVLEKWEGSGKDRVFVGNVLKYKLADRKGYVEMLMRHVGAFEADNGQAGKATANALSALLGQMRGSSLPIVPSPSNDD